MVNWSLLLKGKRGLAAEQCCALQEKRIATAPLGPPNDVFFHVVFGYTENVSFSASLRGVRSATWQPVHTRSRRLLSSQRGDTFIKTSKATSRNLHKRDCYIFEPATISVISRVIAA